MTNNPSPVSPEETVSTVSEWVLWKHYLGKRAASDEQWKKSTSEVAHFFAQRPAKELPTTCDLNHLPLPSKTFFLKHERGHHELAPQNHTEYSLFKKGVQPTWEDHEHCQGELYTQHYFPPELLDQYWQSLVEGVMDGTIDNQHVCGVRVVDKSKNKHPLYKLEIWIDSTLEKVRNQVRAQVMKCMTMDQNHRFKLHWREFAVESDTADSSEAVLPSTTTAPLEPMKQ